MPKTCQIPRMYMYGMPLYLLLPYCVSRETRDQYCTYTSNFSYFRETFRQKLLRQPVRNEDKYKEEVFPSITRFWLVIAINIWRKVSRKMLKID
jgi:hypothetical protein